MNKSYDLVFSRMMTQHLVTPDVQTMLMSVSASGSKYFLTTTVPGISENTELSVVSKALIYFTNNKLFYKKTSMPVVKCPGRLVSVYRGCLCHMEF